MPMSMPMPYGDYDRQNTSAQMTDSTYNEEDYYGAVQPSQVPFPGTMEATDPYPSAYPDYNYEPEPAYPTQMPTTVWSTPSPETSSPHRNSTHRKSNGKPQIETVVIVDTPIQDAWRTVSPLSSDDEDYPPYYDRPPVNETVASPVQTPFGYCEKTEEQEPPTSYPNSEHSIEEQEVPEEPFVSLPFRHYSQLSVLAGEFVKKIKGLLLIRDVNMYSEGFSGTEAVTTIKDLIKELSGEDKSREFCTAVGTKMMQGDKPLITPDFESEIAQLRMALFDDRQEYYQLGEEEGKPCIPTGVITEWTRCYVYGCEPGNPGCYSPSCPNKTAEPDSPSSASAGLFNELPDEEVEIARDGDASGIGKAWQEKVSPEVLQRLTKKEILRQEAINEFIYSEERYMKDLLKIQEVFIPVIRSSSVIEDSRRMKFIQDVYSNYDALIGHSANFCQALIQRQKEFSGDAIPLIGDIALRHIGYLRKDIQLYSSRAPRADYIARTECRRNPEFNRLMELQKKEDRNNDFRQSYLAPSTRMQRYSLLLKPIIEKTDENNLMEIDFLQKANSLITEAASEANYRAERETEEIELLSVMDNLTPKLDEEYDMLRSPRRKLYKRGPLSTKPRVSANETQDKSDAYLILLDCHLLITKLKTTNDHEEYRISKRPIPLQFLGIQSGKAQLATSSSSYMLHSAVGGGGVTAPSLTISHTGDGTIFTFYCSSQDEQRQWVDAIETAKQALKDRQPVIFDLREHPVRGPIKILCTAPIVNSRGEKMIAMGSDDGVRVKGEYGGDFRKVLDCDNVIQIGVLEEYHILLVLSNKVLKAYPLSVLDSQGKPNNQTIAKDVSFFKIGHHDRKIFLVYKKKQSDRSNFYLLEPTCSMEDARNEKVFSRRPGFMRQRPQQDLFKERKQFYVPGDATAIHFLKKKIIVVCGRSFEVIDPENTNVSRSIPDLDDPTFNFIQRVCKDPKPLAMYRNDGEFVVCYDKIVFSVSNKGGGSLIHEDKRAKYFTWEGFPDHIIYYKPYVIAFSPRFIEVRHIISGEIVQVISRENSKITFCTEGDTPIVFGCIDDKAAFELCMVNDEGPSEPL